MIHPPLAKMLAGAIIANQDPRLTGTTTFQNNQGKKDSVTLIARDPLDSAALCKAREAFFNLPETASFLSEWPARSTDDAALEPSAGDAEFQSANSDRRQWRGCS